MPQKSKRKSSSPNTPIPPPNKRGRPRKAVALEALSPFGRHEVTTVEKCASPEKKWKPTTKKMDDGRMNPATSERYYTMDEMEFMDALAEFKRTSGRLFPTCSEILGILRRLGYEKISRE